MKYEYCVFDEYITKAEKENKKKNKNLSKMVMC